MVKLQRARGAAEIVRVASQHVGSISPSSAAAALLRAANAVKQPGCAAENAAIASSSETMVLAHHVAEADDSASTSVLLLRALSLLGWRADPGSGNRARSAILERLASCACARAGELTATEVTALEWAALKLRLALPAAEAPHGALPFRALSGVFADSVSYAALEAELRPHLRRELIALCDSQGERLVPEARLTGWWSRAGVPFRYSGKEMAPGIPDGGLLAAVRERLLELSGVDYDSCLVNLYEHGKVGMRYHQDPDQGTLWCSHTHVASFGCTRTFVLRRSDDHEVRHEYTLEHGDVVHMFGGCQRDYQHCIRVERDEADAGPRISLVFKQSLSDV